jgi:hypothetical protein
MATQTFSAPAFMLRGSRPGKSILSQWYEAVSTARQRHADRMIALYVNQMGGKFTDQTERHIESYVTGTSHSLGDSR